MLYNSPQFVLFFLIVYSLYLVLRHKQQNAMLLIASYVFYGAWNWKYLFLIILSTLTTYLAGLKIQESGTLQRKKVYLWLGISFNLVMLFIFKYYNFFIQNFADLLHKVGVGADLPLLKVLLPAGISFYTFQGVAYVVDVYRGRIPAVANLMDYALFKAFFPQLVAGPIERAEHLLPQVLNPRCISRPQVEEGIFLIIFGLFQKVFLADNLAALVDPVFNAGVPSSGVQSLLICYAFTFQIFFDFAGYSNIARGLAKVMGFDLMVNFDRPYLSPNIQEFWNRWHISLSLWVKDYLYMPLFVSLNIENGKVRAYSAVLLSMLLMGLWHGAGWTFIVFGLYHGVLLVTHAILRPTLAARTKFQSIWAVRCWFGLRVAFLFHLVAVGMLLFRSQSLSQAGVFLRKILFEFSGAEAKLAWTIVYYLFWAFFAMACGWLRTAGKIKPVFFRDLTSGLCSGVLLYFILLHGIANKAFIYFQF